MDKMYSISEAAAKVEVETHVLRYWEEELGIDIKRNEMGHRYYEERDVKILQRVKTLKDKGIQLKADPSPKIKALGNIIETYRSLTYQQNVLDFSSIQVETYNLLKRTGFSFCSSHL